MIVEYFQFDVIDGIVMFIIDCFEKKNVIMYQMLFDFVGLVCEVFENDDVCVFILMGKDGFFCVGIDFVDFEMIFGKKCGVCGEVYEGDVWWLFVFCLKLVIVVIDGFVVGMGVEFSSQCDVCLVMFCVCFVWNFVYCGLVLDIGVGLWLLFCLFGFQKVLQFFYLGDFLSVEEVFDVGYVFDVVELEQFVECV